MAGSVATLIKLTESQDDAVALAAVSALGRIASGPAIGALSALRKSTRAALQSEIVDASLRAAEALAAQGQADEAGKIYEELGQIEQGRERPHRRVDRVRPDPGREGSAHSWMAALKGSDERMQLIAARCLLTVPGKEASEQIAAAPSRAPRRPPRSC